MKKKKLRLQKETLRQLTGSNLSRALGRTETIIETQDSNCGCTGTDFCTNPQICGTITDPGCGPSCELVPC